MKIELQIMKKPLLFLSILLIFNECRKAPDFSELSSDFVVSTSQDKNANFSSYSTFFISDTVVGIGTADTFLVDASAQQLVQTVKDNLTSRGYTFAPRSGNPDLGITLSVVKDINVIVDYYPGWWDGWWNWWYPYYPYYYPWTTVYAYTTGTVIVNMYDLKNASDKGQYTGIWNITGLGAVGNDLNTNLDLGIKAINDGFDQSPYVQK